MADMDDLAQSECVELLKGLTSVESLSWNRRAECP